MSETATLVSGGTLPSKDAVLAVGPGLVGAHVSISYRSDDEGARKLLHLAWHSRLREDESELGLWVVPKLDDLALANIRTSASLIARRRGEGRVPYSFSREDASYDTAGLLVLGTSLGLTCATFVQLVFEHARVPIIDEASWAERGPERIAEDTAAQITLVEAMRAEPQAAEHADLVAEQVGCTRVRAEEIAAASGLTGQPVSFARANRAGRDLLKRMREAISKRRVDR